MTETTTTDRKLVAWVTTHASMPEADPGILVTSIDRADVTDVQEVVTSDAQLPYWAVAEDDGLVESAADSLLAELGYRRIAGRDGWWEQGGGQWNAEVEQI